eukprot:311393-Hanusia_phi.AAC.1
MFFILPADTAVPGAVRINPKIQVRCLPIKPQRFGGSRSNRNVSGAPCGRLLDNGHALLTAGRRLTR